MSSLFVASNRGYRVCWSDTKKMHSAVSAMPHNWEPEIRIPLVQARPAQKPYHNHLQGEPFSIPASYEHRFYHSGLRDRSILFQLHVYQHGPKEAQPSPSPLLPQIFNLVYWKLWSHPQGLLASTLETQSRVDILSLQWPHQQTSRFRTCARTDV